MKEALIPLRPSRLWIARHLVYDAVVKGAVRLRESLQRIDRKSLISFANYFFKKATMIGLAALVFITVPSATISLLGHVAVEWLGGPSNFNFNYRAIEMSPVNVKSLKIATSNVADEQHQRSIRRYWAEAVEHANRAHTKIAMVENYTVVLLLHSMSRNRENPRDLMIGALVDVLSAGGSDSQAMEKARLALTLGEQRVGSESFLISQFGPVQSCMGVPLFKTLIAPMRMNSAPAGPCTRMTLLNKAGGFFMGLIISILLGLIAFFLIIFTKKVTRFLIQIVDEKMQNRAGEITARWEAVQVGGAMRSTASCPSKSLRL